MDGKQEINNWKLVEVIDEIAVVNKNSQDYLSEIFEKENIIESAFKGISRSNTRIDWNKMPVYHKFFFDHEGEEMNNQLAFKNSKLSEKENLIITYGWKEPTIKIATQKFINEWEDFIASTHWETIIFSEDLELIIEVSRDYFMHSNFLIK